MVRYLTCFRFSLLLTLVAVPGSHAQGTVTVAQAVASGNWTQVETLANAALAHRREDPAAWTYLGLAQDHRGDHQQALKSFSEASHLAPDATYALNNLGASYESNDQPQKAITAYRRSLALDHSQPAALVNLARLLSRSGPAAQPEVQEMLSDAWRLAPAPDVARSLLLLSPCASADMPPPEPVNLVAPYVALLTAERATTTSTDDLLAAHAALACGFKEAAVALYRDILVTEPRNSQAIVGLARAQCSSGQERAAGLTLEQAIADGVHRAPIYALLSEVYAATGHPDNAVGMMKQAITAEPGDATLRFRYGMLLVSLRAPKAAQIRTAEALRQFPDSPKLWFLLGISQFDQADPVQAQSSFDRAIALDGHFAPALAYRGLCALDQQRYLEAESWYRQAIALDPLAADFHALLAEALEHQQPEPSAQIRSELEQSLALDPMLAASYLALSRLDLEAGAPARTITEARHALALDPKLRQAHFYLSRAYRQTHDATQSEAEAKLFAEQRAGEDDAERQAFLARVRQLSNTSF